MATSASAILLLGSASIQSLVPSTLISQVESPLDSHRYEEAIDLADQQLRKVQQAPPDATSLEQVEELNYVYQLIGFQCFAETRFDDAGKLFTKGNLDPRLLVSYYPGLRGGLFSSDDQVDVFQGVADKMPTEDSVEAIVAANLVRNYSPHLSPDMSGTVELTRVLVMAAEEMLEGFLSRWRGTMGHRYVSLEASKAAKEKGREKDKGKAKAADPSCQVVDTVLTKLYAQFDKEPELYALIHGPNFIVLSEVEDALIHARQFDALCQLYKQQGEEHKLLDLYSKLIDGVWTDDRVSDPISDMIRVVQDKKDRSLTQQWAVWLVKRDPDRGIKLLISKDAAKRKEKPEEDIALLDEVNNANAGAGQEYLEYLVLQRKSSSAELHTRLAVLYAERVSSFLEEDSVLKLWRAKASSYASSQPPPETAFISYFASTTPDSPHKRARLKLILILAGSPLYDANLLKQTLAKLEAVLRIECAIVDARRGDHHAVLVALAHDVRDLVSAEMYCAVGGGVDGVFDRKMALSLGGVEGGEVGKCVSGLFGGSAPALVEDGGEKEDEKKRLMRMLLEVYMSDPKGTPARTAKLLNAQAVHLDSEDVLSIVPLDWPVQVLSLFLSRSFRRLLHLQHEGRIVKSISAGQNLKVKDETWDDLRQGGHFVEEAADRGGTGTAMHLSDLT
ncbi:hypothetical protein AX14_003009 [Amanita brunnescens Koide BX004]|nr:hypothetical protein AX14_003009 [Amanita brunnescens Koide BX004]